MNSRSTTNLFLALIAGLLIAFVASPASNSTTRSTKTTYDAVKLAEYEACLNFYDFGSGALWAPGDIKYVKENPVVGKFVALEVCSIYKPR